MRRMLLKTLFALMLCLVQAGYAETQRAPKRPSLDALRERAETYWSLLAKRQKTQAVSFVDKASRENFFARQEPDFSNPRIGKIEFASDNK